MKNTITLKDLVNFKEGYKKDLNEIEATLALTSMKMFLLAHCRKNSKAYNNICCMSIENLRESVGCFQRLVYENGKSYYIACQSYTEEISTLKKYVQKHCC